jgi:hypothetical protein
VSELEKQLQQQNLKSRHDSSPKQLLQDSPVLQELEAKLARTENEKQALAEKLDSQVLANIMQLS